MSVAAEFGEQVNEAGAADALGGRVAYGGAEGASVLDADGFDRAVVAGHSVGYLAALEGGAGGA